METERVVGVEGSLEALRCRLYRRDATAEDVRRYEERVAGLVPPEPAVVGPSPARPSSVTPPPVAALVEPAPARPGRRSRLLTAVLVVGAFAVGGLATRLTAEAAPPGPMATAAAAHASAAPATEPDELPWRPEHWVRGARLPSDPSAQQFHGRGAGDAELDTARLPGSTGRLELLLTLEVTAPVGWEATRVDRGPGSIVTVQVLAQWSGRQRQAIPERLDLRYAGGPPTAVHVHVPDGVAWGLVVAPRS